MKILFSILILMSISILGLAQESNSDTNAVPYELSLAPGICQNPQLADSYGCTCANASYCFNPQYANTRACRGSFPGYCQNPQYSNTTACGPCFN
jgi:hypothetical protein